MKTTLKNYKLLIVLLAIVAAFSCSKKDDDNTPPEPTVAELLAHKWFFVKQVSGQPPVTQFANDCEATSYFNFLSNGDLIFQRYILDSNNDCVSNGLESFTYTLTADEKQIVVTGGSIPALWDIIILTETELVMEVDFGIVTLKREP